MWGSFVQQKLRRWQAYHPWIVSVLLLHIVFFVINKSQWFEQLFIERSHVFAGGFDILYRRSFTGAYSDIWIYFWM
jgi:hypothetical protein